MSQKETVISKHLLILSDYKSGPVFSDVKMTKITAKTATLSQQQKLYRCHNNNFLISFTKNLYHFATQSHSNIDIVSRSIYNVQILK